MNVPFVDLAYQYNALKVGIDKVISDVIKESDFIRGKHTEPFEKEYANTIGAKHCVSCANGTDAIYIALKALQLESKDEVITTAHSWISTSETITQAGGVVKFVDTELGTFNIDTTKIESQITNKTKGIIVVHLCGQPANLTEIQLICNKYKLWLIEDCAQAHLAKFENRYVGTFGDIGTFSFYPGKNLGAMGDAGAIVTNNSDIANWVKLYARHGGKGEHLIEGINSRIDGLQAGILRVKLPHLKDWNIKRQEAAQYYNHLFSDINYIEIPKILKNRDHVFHLYMIKCNKRNSLREYLSKNNISTSINYNKPLPLYKAYKYLKYSKKDFPKALQNSKEILSLPIFPGITKTQQEYVVNNIKEFYS